jgi:nucleotide-binding universal stress UspA family protein
VAQGDAERRADVFKKILVPCDGSELAQGSVFPHVQSLAQKMDAEVIILRVVSAPAGRSGSAFKPGAPELPIPLPVTPDDALTVHHPIYRDQEIASAEDEARRSVAQAEAMFRDQGVKVRSQVLLGQPAEEIIDYAAEQGVDLIVMCTHGKSGIGRWVFGSVTEKVLRGATPPVLIIRPEELHSQKK